MKTTIIFLLALMGCSAQAQLSAWDKFFYSTLWEIPVHDSCTFWGDSVHPANLRGAYSQQLNASGFTDSLEYFDFTEGRSIYFQSGKTTGNSHVVREFMMDQNNYPQPSERTTLVSDQQGRISEVYIDYYFDTVYFENLMYEVMYHADNRIDRIGVKVWYGTHYAPAATYVYNYQGVKLDNVSLNMLMGGVMVTQFQLFYNAGVLEGVNEYNSGSPGISRQFTFERNAQQEIQFVTERSGDGQGSLWVYQVFEYGQKKSPAVDIPGEESVKMEIFPNPVQEYVIISGPDLVEYRILNIMGQPVMAGELTERVNLSELKPGTYLLQAISREGKSAVRKILKT
ncbi:MAG: T9SS type A sorting domain-containing protein [Owenweeksia sp.]